MRTITEEQWKQLHEAGDRHQRLKAENSQLRALVRKLVAGVNVEGLTGHVNVKMRVDLVREARLHTSASK